MVNKDLNDDVFELRRVVHQLSQSLSSVRRDYEGFDVEELLGSIFPVGSVFVSGSDQLPVLIGRLGSWQRLEGRVIVGVQDSVTAFNTVNKTGGARTHTLTINEMPSHNHLIGRGNSDPNTVIATDVKTINANSGTLPTQSRGGSQAHNNLQPYKTKFMWERIS